MRQRILTLPGDMPGQPRCLVILLLAGMALSACDSRESVSEPENVADSYLEAVERARSVEDALDEAVKAQREAIEEQGG